MLRSKQSVPTGVRIIAFFSFMAGFWFINQSVTTITSSLLDGIVNMVDGIVSITVGVGFTLAAKWSWTLRVIISIVLITEATLTLLLLTSDDSFGLPEYSQESVFSIVALIINPLVLYYLYRPHVKAYFGKVTSIKYL